MNSSSGSDSVDNKDNSILPSYVSTRPSNTVAVPNENSDSLSLTDDNSVAFPVIFSAFIAFAIVVVIKVIAFLADLVFFADDVYVILMNFVTFVAFIAFTVFFAVVFVAVDVVIKAMVFLAELIVFAFSFIAFVIRMNIAVMGLINITPFQIFLAYLVFLVIAAVVVLKVSGSGENKEIQNGLSETNLNKLVQATYNKTEAAFISAVGDRSTCQICQEDFNLGDLIVQLPCRHIFCKSCILTWLKVKVTCPCCRDDVQSKFT